MLKSAVSRFTAGFKDLLERQSNLVSVLQVCLSVVCLSSDVVIV